MRNRRVMIIGVVGMLLIGSLIGSGCGSTSTSASTSSASAPEPASTPMQEPTQEPPSVQHDDLANVCYGIGVPEVAPYTQTPGLHPVVYVQERADGKWRAPAKDYSSPSPWQPQELAKVQLVACIEENPKEIEQCPYTLSNGLRATVTRVMVNAFITLREAQTGKVVDQEVVAGGIPADCQASESFPQGTYSKTVTGERAKAKLEKWLKQYAEVP